MVRASAPGFAAFIRNIGMLKVAHKFCGPVFQSGYVILVNQPWHLIAFELNFCMSCFLKLGLHQRKSCNRKRNPSSSLSDFDNWFRWLQGSLDTGQQPLYTSLHGNVKNIDVDSYKLNGTDSLMQFNLMAVLSSELRMREPSKQHPPIIYFFILLFIVCAWIPGLLYLTNKNKK